MEAKPFDIVVLTAANESQAEGYRVQLALRRQNGLLPESVRAEVITDLGGRRIGSFTATLNVLKALFPNGFPEKFPRILICHSGGDSKRLPAYAALGKAFAPLPMEGERGQPMAIFDLILLNAKKIQFESGILVASGDVVLTFRDELLQKLVCSVKGVTGIGTFRSIQQASRHGVYIPEEKSDTQLSKVASFLQKPSRDELAAAGGITESDQAIVDTGLFVLSAEVCEKLYYFTDEAFLADVASGKMGQMDIYEEFPMALIPQMTLEEYRSYFAKRRSSDSYYQGRITQLWNLMQGTEFLVAVATWCDFFHIGSSVELLDALTKPNQTAELYRFGNRKTIDSVEDESRWNTIYHSADVEIEAEGPVVVEGIQGPRKIKLCGENILTGLPKCTCEEIEVDEKVGIVGMPLKEGQWAIVAYGITDDFKTPYIAGDGCGRCCSFLNQDIRKWMEEFGVTDKELWDGDEASGLWTARLWLVGSVDEAMEDTLAILRKGEKGKCAKFECGKKRYSMSQLVQMIRR